MFTKLIKKFKQKQSIVLLIVFIVASFYFGAFIKSDEIYSPDHHPSSDIIIGLLEELQSINIDATLIHKVAGLDNTRKSQPINISEPQNNSIQTPGNISSYSSGTNNPFRR